MNGVGRQPANRSVELSTTQQTDSNTQDYSPFGETACFTPLKPLFLRRFVDMKTDVTEEENSVCETGM